MKGLLDALLWLLKLPFRIIGWFLKELFRITKSEQKENMKRRQRKSNYRRWR